MAVTGLTPSHEYELRVYAENVYGRSDPAISNIVQTKDAGKKKIPKKKYEGKIMIHLPTITIIHFHQRIQSFSQILLGRLTEMFVLVDETGKK